LFNKFKKKPNKFSLLSHLIPFKSEKFINLRSLKLNRAVSCLPGMQVQVVRALDSYPPEADGGSKGKGRIEEN
jgi:hypothetical protein